MHITWYWPVRNFFMLQLTLPLPSSTLRSVCRRGRRWFGVCTDMSETWSQRQAAYNAPWLPLPGFCKLQR